MSSTRRHVTILISGSGIAGCTAALTLADAGRDVLLINAGPDLDDGNTPLAQGGIIYKAADTPRDAEARALEHDGIPVFHSGQDVLAGLRLEEIAALAQRWSQFNQTENPSLLQSEAQVE